MNDWQKHGTIRKHVIHKTMDNPFEVPDFKDQVDRTFNWMLEKNEPPEVRATLDRLLGLSLREDYARYLVSCVLAAEVIETAENGPTEDWDRLTSRLSTLPETPWIVGDH